MMRKVLLTPEKEVESFVQRTRLFKIACKTKDRVCKVTVDRGSTDNLVSIEMVEKLELDVTPCFPQLVNITGLAKNYGELTNMNM
jgi:hypothetical protein